MQTTPFGIPEWDEWRSDIKKVVIEDGVTAISTTAFNGCPMSEIEIADSVTTIGEEAFSDCSVLKLITIPQNVAKIEEYAFSNCSSFESIILESSDCNIYDGSYTICNSREFGTGDDAANILSYYAYLAANGTEKDMKKWYESVIRH